MIRSILFELWFFKWRTRTTHRTYLFLEYQRESFRIVFVTCWEADCWQRRPDFGLADPLWFASSSVCVASGAENRGRFVSTTPTVFRLSLRFARILKERGGCQPWNEGHHQMALTSFMHNDLRYYVVVRIAAFQTKERKWFAEQTGSVGSTADRNQFGWFRHLQSSGVDSNPSGVDGIPAKAPKNVEFSF